MTTKKVEKLKKKFAFVNKSARREFLNFPKSIQFQFGSDLYAIQCSQRPFSEFKDISGSVGRGAIELIGNGGPAYRVIYCAKYLDTVFVLHAFEKTTNGVDRQAMRTAARRYRDLVSQLDEHKKKAKRDATSAPAK